MGGTGSGECFGFEVGVFFVKASFPNTNLSPSASLFLPIGGEGLGPVCFPVLSNSPHVDDGSHSTPPNPSLGKPPPGHLPSYGAN